MKTSARHFIARLDLVRFIYIKLQPGSGWVLLFTFALALLAAVQLIFEIFEPSSNRVFLTASVVGVIASILQLFAKLQGAPRLKITPDRDIERRWHGTLPSLLEAQDGFVLHSLVIPEAPRSTSFQTCSLWILMSPALNRVLRDPSRDFRVVRDMDQEKSIRDDLRRKSKMGEKLIRHAVATALRHEKDFRNEEKIGICSPVLTTAQTVSLIRTDYYSGYLTNDLSASKINDDPREDPAAARRVCEFPIVTSKDALRFKDLGESTLTNNTGASTLALSADGYLVVWKQNSASMISSELLAPTGSGSTDWEDAKGCSTLKAIILRTLEREFREESLNRNFQLPIRASRLIGYYRNIVRGGKPEFVGISHLNLNASHLLPNRTEVHDGFCRINDHKLSSLVELKQVVDESLSGELRFSLSTPLWVTFLALRQFIDEDERQIAEFFQLPVR